MKTKIDEDIKQMLIAAGAFTLLGAAFLVLAIGLAFGSAYLEAKAYNRVTGNNVSTWDAVFLDLRVQDQPNSKDDK